MLINELSQIFIGHHFDVKSDEDVNTKEDIYCYLTLNALDKQNIIKDNLLFITNKFLRKYDLQANMKGNIPFNMQVILAYNDFLIYEKAGNFEIIPYQNQIVQKVIPSDEIIVIRPTTSYLTDFLLQSGGREYVIDKLKTFYKNNDDISKLISFIATIDCDESYLASDKSSTALNKKIDLTNVKILPRTTSLDNIIKRLNNNEINIFTDFQRQASIWKDAKVQSRFIESILINFFPLPYFYFDASDEDKWLVVDGLQRLSTIQQFINNTLVLKDLEYLTDLNGKCYKDLDRRYARVFEEREITMFIIYKGTPPEVKYSIFNRLNKSEPLNPQEIRHALNPNKPATYIKKLANLKEFNLMVKKWLKAEKIERMEDKEIALSHVAFRFWRNDYVSYGEDEQLFLDTAMSYIYEVSDLILKDYEIHLQKSLQVLMQIFDDTIFTETNTEEDIIFNIHLFKVWTVLVAELTDSKRKKLVVNKKALQQDYDQLKKVKEFQQSLNKKTQTISSIEQKFKAIGFLIKKYAE